MTPKEEADFALLVAHKTDMAEFAVKVRHMIEACGLTKLQIIERADITPGKLETILADASGVPVAIVAKVAWACGYKLDLKLAPVLCQQRLRAVLNTFGWGPKEGHIVFTRSGRGWRIGDGVAVVAFSKGDSVPEDAETALRVLEENIWKNTR